MKEFIVTIDGPAGAGKTTVAREVGLTLNWFVLFSGNIYRALAFVISEDYKAKIIPISDKLTETDVVPLINEILPRISFDKTPGGKTEILIDGIRREDALKRQNIGELASVLAQNPHIRKALLPLQRSIRKQEKQLIAEGRDMGTVVFPDANIKFFLTASVEIRADRRVKELREMGFSPEFEKIISEIRERDERDEKRSVSPLKPATDAIVIDTSEMTIKQVVSEIIDLINPRISEEQEADLYETRFRR